MQSRTIILSVAALLILGATRRSFGDDYDGDGDVDLADFWAMQSGITGPDVPYEEVPLSAFDQDFDDDLDFADFVQFAIRYTGVQTESAGYLPVAEEAAVYLGGVPLADHPRRYIEQGGTVVVAGAEPQIVAPDHDLLPFVYGQAEDYILSRSGAGIYQAKFLEAGPYFLALDEGSGFTSSFVLVLVGMKLPEAQDTEYATFCHSQEWSSFDPPIGSVCYVSEPLSDPALKNAYDYFKASGAWLFSVEDVQTDIDHLRIYGPQDRVVFVGHGLYGMITQGSTDDTCLGSGFKWNF